MTPKQDPASDPPDAVRSVPDAVRSPDRVRSPHGTRRGRPAGRSRRGGPAGSSPLPPRLARAAMSARPETERRRDRAHGALAGLALGDAMGMPTQSMSPAAIAREFGVIAALRDAPSDQPITPSSRAGTVTDDTEQALVLARVLIEGGGQIDPAKLAAALTAWEVSMIERGSHDLLGPSTKAALAAINSGVDLTEAGKAGATNGAAMRIAPVGIVRRPGRGLWASVLDAARLTHGTNLGLASAYAVAAAVSQGVEGSGPLDAVIAGIAAAHFGAQHGAWVAGADIAARFDALAPLARSLGGGAFTGFLSDVVGTSIQSQESVVAAFLLVERFADEPFDALTEAAAIGGDTDTIGAIAGAILGACRGATAFPPDALAQVEAVNGLGLESVADRLIALRA